MKLPRPKVEQDGFTVRRTDSSRLEGFSDGVFGFSVALLVIAMEVPKSFDQLASSLRSSVAFAACFAILYYIWNLHYVFCRRFGLEDVPTRLLTGLLLFLVTLYVYPLKFLALILFNLVLGLDRSQALTITLQQLSQLFQIYGIGFGLIFGVLAALYYHAFRQADMLEMGSAERFATKHEAVSMLIVTGVALVSVACAALLPRSGGLPGMVYFFVGPLAAGHGVWSGKQIRAMVARDQPA